MPFDLGDDPARLRPGPGLISEIRIVTPHLLPKEPNGSKIGSYLGNVGYIRTTLENKK
jgi:hypothetical protein